MYEPSPIRHQAGERNPKSKIQNLQWPLQSHMKLAIIFSQQEEYPWRGRIDINTSRIFAVLLQL